MRTWALQPAMGPMTCAWAASPRRMFRGLRAYQGVNAHVQGFPCEQHSTTDTLVPKTQTTSTTTPRLSAFFAEVVCTLGTTPPQTAISPPPNGGNDVIRTTTRRRHAASQPLMLQNPTATGMEGAGGTCRCAGGRWRGLAGLRADAPSEARGADGSRAGRRPPAHTAAGASVQPPYRPRGRPHQDTHRAVRQDDPDADDHPPQAPLRGRQVLRGEELIHPVTTGRLRSRIRGRCHATTLAQSSLCPRGSVNR